MKRYIASLLLSFCFTTLCFAQEQLGILIDNYGGINSVLLNPTHNLTSPLKWDINLVSAGMNFQTNYAFSKKSNLFHSLKRTDNIILQRDMELQTVPSEDDLVMDFYDNQKLKYITAFANGMGPSFMINLESGHTFGLFTNARFGLSTQDVPPEMSLNVIYDTPFYEYLDINAFNITSMAWAEIGVNYAFKKETYDGAIGFGINAKLINAFEGAFVKTNRVHRMAQIPGDTLHFRSISVDFGITTKNAEGNGNYDISSTGFGASFDLGFVYIYEGDKENYKWKFGASLLDVGQIQFNKFAETHDIFADTFQVIALNDYESGSVKTRIENLSENILGTEEASLKGRKFSIWTPAAFSAQFDYMFSENIYANAIFVQRLVFGETALRRNNLLAITPRFEHRWLGAAFPVSLLNYDRLLFGTSFRLAFLTLGSDDLLGLFGKRDFNGAGFYFALKFNPFETNLNLFNGLGGGSKKGVKCYQF